MRRQTAPRKPARREQSFWLKTSTRDLFSKTQNHKQHHGERGERIPLHLVDQVLLVVGAGGRASTPVNPGPPVCSSTKGGIW